MLKLGVCWLNLLPCKFILFSNKSYSFNWSKISLKLDYKDLYSWRAINARVVFAYENLYMNLMYRNNQSIISHASAVHMTQQNINIKHLKIKIFVKFTMMFATSLLFVFVLMNSVGICNYLDLYFISYGDICTYLVL